MYYLLLGYRIFCCCCYRIFFDDCVTVAIFLHSLTWGKIKFRLILKPYFRKRIHMNIKNSIDNIVSANTNMHQFWRNVCKLLSRYVLFGGLLLYFFIVRFPDSSTRLAWFPQYSIFQLP